MSANRGGLSEGRTAPINCAKRNECVTIVKPVSQENYTFANRYHADHAQFLIAVSDHADALPADVMLADMKQMEAYALQKDLGIIFIHPNTVEVRGVF